MNSATFSASAPAPINMFPPIAADCSTSGGPRPCWPSCRPHDPDWPHSSSGDTGWPDPNSRVTSRHLGLGQGGDPGVHVEIEPTVEVHVLPDQRRQRVQVSGVQSAGPVRASENLLEHEGADEDHAVLEQVQAEHAQLLVLALVARELAAAGEEHEVIGAVPVLDDVEPIVNLAPQALIVKIAA